MFYAIDSETGTLCFSGEAKRTAIKGRYVCPECRDEVYIRGGEFSSVARHFAHYPESTCRQASLSSGESAIHMGTKAYLFNRLSQRGDVSEIEMERTIGNRRADLWVRTVDGVERVFEVQASSQTMSAFSERERDYKRCGIDQVTWIVGDWMTNSVASELVELGHDILQFTGATEVVVETKEVSFSPFNEISKVKDAS